MSVKKGSLRTTGSFVRPGHSNPSDRGPVVTQIAQSVEDDEAEEIRAMIRRDLRTRLMGAGLLSPNRRMTPESAALEAQIRQEAQRRLENALFSLARRRATEAEALPQDDFLVSQAVEWIEQLAEDASDCEAPLQIINDWSIIADITGSTGHKLSENGKEIIKKYFLGYLALGDAPSLELQKTFDYFRVRFENSENIYLPPKKLIEVFHRLFATDIEIEKKRRASMAASAFIKNLNKREAEILRQKQNQTKRKLLARFIFLNVAWVLVVLSGIWVAGENLSDMYSDDQNRVMFVCALPMIVWIGWRLYRKLS